MIVLDSSAAIAWVLPDEQGQDPGWLHRLSSAETAIVPVHWILEVTNVLRMAVKRRRLAPGEPAQVLDRMSQQPIEVDPETIGRGWRDIPAIADRYDLTTYDAAYLELAMRLEVPLATLDEDLARAARTARVPLYT
jgi:predicted nucleic acid-binding protein